MIDNHSTLLCRDEPANLPICWPDMVCPVLRDGQYSDHLTDQASYHGVIFDYQSLILVQRTSLIPERTMESEYSNIQNLECSLNGLSIVLQGILKHEQPRKAAFLKRSDQNGPDGI
ncbi:hypothetical protein [Leptospira noguchii]|nr:hypothetical protein [Leptospira noguchii]